MILRRTMFVRSYLDATARTSYHCGSCLSTNGRSCLSLTCGPSFLDRLHNQSETGSFCLRSLLRRHVGSIQSGRLEVNAHNKQVPLRPSAADRELTKERGPRERPVAVVRCLQQAMSFQPDAPRSVPQQRLILLALIHATRGERYLSKYQEN